MQFWWFIFTIISIIIPARSWTSAPHKQYRHVHPFCCCCPQTWPPLETAASRCLFNHLSNVSEQSGKQTGFKQNPWVGQTYLDENTKAGFLFLPKVSVVNIKPRLRPDILLFLYFPVRRTVSLSVLQPNEVAQIILLNSCLIIFDCSRFSPRQTLLVINGNDDQTCKKK